MKQAFEKQLQCERTLKTQASLPLNISKAAEVVTRKPLPPDRCHTASLTPSPHPPPILCICLQAVNKLEEIMNRTAFRGGGSRRGNGTDMRRKEKENRKLQLELRSEKEKLNSSIIKYQREINEMQAVGGMFPRLGALFVTLRQPYEHESSRIHPLGHHVP